MKQVSGAFMSRVITEDEEKNDADTAEQDEVVDAQKEGTEEGTDKQVSDVSMNEDSSENVAAADVQDDTDEDELEDADDEEALEVHPPRRRAVAGAACR